MEFWLSKEILLGIPSNAKLYTVFQNCGSTIILFPNYVYSYATYVGLKTHSDYFLSRPAESVGRYD